MGQDSNTIDQNFIHFFHFKIHILKPYYTSRLLGTEDARMKYTQVQLPVCFKTMTLNPYIQTCASPKAPGARLPGGLLLK